MARGPKPKKLRTAEEDKIIKEVASEILGETFEMDPNEIKKRIDLEAAEAFEAIEQEAVLTIDTSNKEYDQWDVKKDEEIKCFDGTKSYEITGYRPVDELRGLDFKPEWFTETREVKQRTGKYCAYPPGTKKYADFWNELFRRCNEGYVSHGYRLTGDHYFFLNFYRLKDTNTGAAGMGRSTAFPSFFSKLYEYFHYIDLCKVTRHDVCALKARGVGFSEIAACLGVRLYSTARGSTVVYAAHTDKYVGDVLDKCWELLDYLNADTEGGMRHARQKYNSDSHKRASLLNKAREEFGFMSDISGVTVDKPSKLRGDRVDLLIFEESGSNPNLMTTYIQSRALVEILGNKFGIRIVFGTGGDTGKALEGLKKMFYNPTGFLVLPYHHNYTESGDYVDTAFFIPAFTFVAKPGFIDLRGVTNSEKAKKFYNDTNLAIEDPQDQIKDRAEFCFTPEDALALEGDNMFDRVILSQQRALIELHKVGPHIDKGVMEWDLEGGIQKKECIKGVRFKNDGKGPVQILEHPIMDANSNVAKNMYVAGIDGIDLGLEDTSSETRDPSKFAVIIIKRALGLDGPKIVAIYKDRPEKLREAHLLTMRLLWYYNCQAVLESTRVSLLTFFREWKLEDRFLMRRPSFCNSNLEISRLFGAPATEAIIKHLLELILAFISDYGLDIWFIDFITEALTYSIENKRKFDLIAAMGMAMLGDEELTLRGMKPKFEKEQDKIIRPFGYWVDERGIRHKGRIPDKPLPKPIANWNVVGDGRVNGRTSKGFD